MEKSSEKACTFQVLVATANMIATQSHLFSGILTLRMGWLIRGMQMFLEYTRG